VRRESDAAAALPRNRMNSRRLTASPAPRSTSGIRRISPFWIEDCVVCHTHADRCHVRFGSLATSRRIGTRSARPESGHREIRTRSVAEKGEGRLATRILLQFQTVRQELAVDCTGESCFSVSLPPPAEVLAGASVFRSRRSRTRVALCLAPCVYALNDLITWR